jgi:F-type H+-transporting ATPase subunit epsilon
VVVAVHGGFVEVSGNRVTILSDVAELPDQIDTARAEAAKAAAEEALRADADDQAAKDALARATTRLAVKQGMGSAGGAAH